MGLFRRDINASVAKLMFKFSSGELASAFFRVFLLCEKADWITAITFFRFSVSIIGGSIFRSLTMQLSTSGLGTKQVRGTKWTKST